MKTCVALALWLAALATTARAESVKLPSYLKQCSRSDPDFNGCVLRNGIAAIPSLVHGEPKLKVPMLDPLKVEHVRLEQGDGPVGITLDLTDALVYGLKNTELKAANFDLKNKELSVDIAVKDTDLQIISKYGIKGKVLVLPINGEGDLNLTLKNFVGTYKTKYDLYKKDDGLEYIKLTDNEFNFDVSQVFFHFENLFNGDKALGDNMNVFLNENWQEVLKEIKPVVTEVVRSIISKILTQIAERVSYDNLFPN
ncbi:protein takeout-like [Bacillus rossius redtenbacheri]|uniref:protein takeout-like n=1 Tax=Bacillus rossius redtenbacheri TaxID=93214 RepID=UPI002FDCAAD4